MLDAVGAVFCVNWLSSFRIAGGGANVINVAGGGGVSEGSDTEDVKRMENVMRIIQEEIIPLPLPLLKQLVHAMLWHEWSLDHPYRSWRRIITITMIGRRRSGMIRILIWFHGGNHCVDDDTAGVATSSDYNVFIPSMMCPSGKRKAFGTAVLAVTPPQLPALALIGVEAVDEVVLVVNTTAAATRFVTSTASSAPSTTITSLKLLF